MAEKESILIVDDDESTCKSLALIFGKKGYAVETAPTGRAALEKVQGGFFNLALLDINLPDMDGIELITPLKEIDTDIAAIMITGHASLENAVEALNKGASAYILKPLGMDEVLLTVKEALEKQHLVRENRRLLEALQKELAERKVVDEALQKAHYELEQRVDERTAELQKTINLMAGREVRMAELKDIVKQLRKQVQEAGITPVADDPLAGEGIEE